MNGSDLMLSIKCALYEEQINAHKQMKNFDRDEITIMATAEAFYKMVNMRETYGNFYQEGVTKCFGCNLKIIDGEGEKMYLAREIPMIKARLEVEEGAEE